MNMNIAIIGASGFVGSNLTKDLLVNTNHNIVAITHNTLNIVIEEKFKSRVVTIKADVLNYDEMKDALKEVDVAYYLVHLMANDKDDFSEKEIQAAEATSLALKDANVKRVIYLSGLGNDKEELSKHLLSRHKTGEILRKYNNEVIELRASMIIGSGSISFEIVRDLVNKSPVIILPKWAKTKTQPIGLSDLLLYLKESIDINIINSEIIEIGGKDFMSYKDFIKRYANFKKKNILVFCINILSERTAGILLEYFTSKRQSCVGKCMISSFRNEMIVTNNKAQEIFPGIIPLKIEESFI
jgi:uncharacterized protein YbjT (DUF2867 family)